MTENKHLLEGFACSCGKENREKLEKTYEWAKKFLNATDRTFLTYIIYKLAWDYEVRIVGIPNDQWSGIDTANPEGKARMQCDDVTLGFALILKRCYDTWGKTRLDEEEISFGEEDGK